MRRTLFVVGLSVAAVLAAGHDSQARFGRGFGGGGFGGARAGGFGGFESASHGSVGPYGGSGFGSRSYGSAVGPYGGTRDFGAGSGSYTTNRGTTIDYGGIGRGGTTPGGIDYGRGVSGVQVTTPGGREVTRVGTAGGAVGPGGNAIGGRAGATVGSGPGGSFGSAYRGGVAIGPYGAEAGGARVGAATGPGGRTVAGAERGGVAVGPYGAVAGGTRVAGAAGPGGTFYASRSALATTGTAVRTGFGYYNAFTPAWYARYPGAWFAAGWTTARIWAAPAWGTVAAYCGYPAVPVDYDYGTTVVYTGDTVIVDGDHGYSADLYAQQATDIAAAGQAAKVDPKADDWQSLGVFAMVQPGETKSTNIFQLAINKAGVLRGNYYNALTDTTEAVYGSVDKTTQRAAWTVGDRKFPVYEAGIANLTKDETTMLVHFGKDNQQQFTLVRIQQPDPRAPPKQ